MDPRKKIIVINGVHSSGKTTVGRELANYLGYNFYPEIGEDERRRVDYNSLRNYVPYDYNILAKEMARDDGKLIRDPGVPVVETWHVGNLAYLRERTPSLSALGEEVLGRALQKFNPLTVLVDIGWETFRQRAQVGITPHDLEGLVDFYKGVKDQLLKVYTEFGISPVVVNNDGPQEETLKELKRELSIYKLNGEGNHSSKERV